MNDPLLDMISRLIVESNENFFKTLVASASVNVEEAWAKFNEGFAIDEDILKLTHFQIMSGISQAQKHHRPQ